MVSEPLFKVNLSEICVGWAYSFTCYWVAIGPSINI